MHGQDGRPSWTLRFALVVVLVATGLAVPASAHNPADTLFHPVDLGDRWLVTGGEGTWALLEPNGTVLDRGNLSGEGEVLQAPATTGTTAGVIVRSFPDLVPHLQGFDASGPSWTVEVGPPEGNGFVVAREDVFTVFTRDGRQLTITADGGVQQERELQVRPRVAPAPAPEGDWWLASGSELVRLSGGEVVDSAGYSGTPTDVHATEEHVLVSLSHRGEGRSTLMAFDASLDLDWSRSLEGLRLGGTPALQRDAIVVATYDPSGARIVSLAADDGSLLWETRQANATAAASSTLDDRVVAATTEGLVALGENGTEAWSVDADLYLESPWTRDGLLVPSGADNRLVAVRPNGTTAWTWTDGVETPGWASHHAADGPAGAAENASGPASDPRPVPLGSAVLAALAASGLASLLVRRGRQR